MNNFDRLALIFFFWAIIWGIPETVNDERTKIIIGCLLLGTQAMLASMLTTWIRAKRKGSDKGEENVLTS